MADEQVEFRAGRDSYGLARWVPGVVLEREDRAAGQRLRVLPAGSASEEEAQWVSTTDVRPLLQPTD